MSRPTRAARRRADRIGHPARAPRSVDRAHAGDDVGVVAAWCATEAELDEVRQRTHDLVIEMMGTDRAGGVTWRITDDVAHANAGLDMLCDGNTDSDLSRHYRQLRGLVREYGGFLVIAAAPAKQVHR